MERAKLEEFNHWWIEGKVDADLALPFKRDSYHEIERQMHRRLILALVGLRRVGKTTTLYQLIQNLIGSKVKRENVVFFSFDEASAGISEVIEQYKAIHGKDFREEIVYIFLDEIQKCQHWENELKKYYDLYPKLKFVISGSESLFIRKKTKETLAGRIFEFRLNTFSFREYVHFKGIGDDQFKYETRIMPLAENYIRKGGFPETFSFESERDIREYVKSIVIDKIVFRDIPKLSGIEDPEFLRVLLEVIATNPGMYIDYQSLASQFGKDRRVIKDYIFYLQESFLIVLLGNYRKGSMITLRKKKRAYPVDNAITYIYKSGIDEDFLGRMAESLVINKLGARSFWKNGGEVDAVTNDVPVEIKYQNLIGKEDYKTVREFMKKFGKREGMIITKKDEGKVKVDEGTITIVPLWKWLLQQ